MCVSGANGEVFCLHTPSRAQHSTMSVREFSRKKNRLTGKEICKVTWPVGMSALIRSIPSIRSNLVVISIDLVLSTVGVRTKLSKAKRMPAIHKFLDHCDFANPSLTAAVRRVVAVVLVHFEGCWNSPTLPGVWPQQTIELQMRNHLVLTSVHGSFRLFTAIRACSGIDLVQPKMAH